MDDLEELRRAAEELKELIEDYHLTVLEVEPVPSTSDKVPNFVYVYFSVSHPLTTQRLITLDVSLGASDPPAVLDNLDYSDWYGMPDDFYLQPKTFFMAYERCKHYGDYKMRHEISQDSPDLKEKILAGLSCFKRLVIDNAQIELSHLEKSLTVEGAMEIVRRNREAAFLEMEQFRGREV